MILQDVPECSRSVVVTSSARFNTLILGHRDLYMVDVMPIEQRFEDRISESKQQDILNGFFAQVMVDPIDLRFVEQTVQPRAEL